VKTVLVSGLEPVPCLRNAVFYYYINLNIADGGLGWLSRYSDLLRAGRSGDRIPVGARFSATVQNGPEVHPAPYKMNTGPFPGVKRPERGADDPLPSSEEVKERPELYLFSPSGHSWSVLGRTFYFYLRLTAAFITK
jgi:hypothetical protein